MSNLISIFFLVASAGIFFGYVHPTYSNVTSTADLSGKSIVELREEQVRYFDALDKTHEIEEVRTGLLQKYNNISLQDKDRLGKLLPDHIDSVRLIIDVNNIASAYGMTLKNIGLTDSDSATKSSVTGAIGPQEKRFKAVGLKFNVSGSYDNFRAFLRDLETSLRLVDITGIVFNAGKDTPDYSVTLSTYRLVFEKQ